MLQDQMFSPNPRVAQEPQGRAELTPADISHPTE